MDVSKIRLLAFDLDGTLTQHKSPLAPETAEILTRLGKKYKLLMVGAGSCERIHRQMNGYPIDIVGNYGMQVSTCEGGEFKLLETASMPVGDHAPIEAAATALREKYGLTNFAGDNMEYHASGMLTFPLLGTKAVLADKLACDPTHERRARMLPDVKEAFSRYTVFIGGSSSFDIVPRPYDKLYALEQYLLKHGMTLDQAAFFGDDYHPGGNDEQVYLGGVTFIKVDDYRTFPRLAEQFL